MRSLTYSKKTPDDIEEWRACPSVPNYEVSSHGRVRSIPHEVTDKNGKPHKVSGCVRKQTDNGGGYMHIHISALHGHRYVHHLVAEAFIGPKPWKFMHVCHNDGDTKNNRPENLRYDTPEANEGDKKAHGRQRGLHFAVLTPLQVRALRKLEAEFSQSELSKIFCVSQPTISRVLSRTTFKEDEEVQRASC